MGLTRKVAFNTAAQFVGKIATTLLSLILVAALTRYLGVSGFGQYTTIFAYMSLFAVLADFGFFWIFVREIAKPNIDLNKTASNILTMRFFAGLSVFFIGAVLSLIIPQYQEIRTGIFIAALANLFLTLNSTFIGIFQNKLRMDKAVYTDIIGRVVILVVSLLLIKSNMGLNTILWAYALGNLLNLIASALLGRKYFTFRPQFDFRYWAKIWWEILPMGIVLVLNLIYFRIDTLMLSLLKGPADVGIYGPPYKILEILIYFPSMFVGNIFPIIAGFIYSKDPRLESTLQKALDFLFLSAVPLVVSFIFLSPLAIKWVAGQEFVHASTINPIFNLPATSVTALQILMVAVGFSFISHLFNYLIIALGKQIKLILPNLILVIVNIVLNLILIPRFSYLGAAFTTVLTEALVLLFAWWVAKRYLDFNLQYKNFIRVSLTGLAMIGAIFFLQLILPVLLSVVLGVIIYLGLLYLIGGIRKELVLAIFEKR